MELTKLALRDYKVIYVPEYKRVLCKTLIQLSMNTWMPINVRKKDDFRISDNIISISAITNIRKISEEYRCVSSGKKIFISRKNTNLSRITNEEKVADLFRKRGFEIVHTEDLSYKQQVELFSAAICVVGATGAAMTNLVYCNPNTVFGCIIPKKYDFCIYSSIAHMVGMRMLFLDAKVIRSGIAISLDQCKVDIDECCGYIDELEKMIR